MVSRLYRTMCQLFLAAVLVRLHLTTLGTPTLAALIVLVVTGLILLEARPTQTRVARRPPARSHDALNRLLRLISWSTRSLCALLCAFAKRLP